MPDTSDADIISKIRDEGGFFRLPPKLTLKATGNDRLRYLNGQVTADLKKLTPGEAIKACLLTPKGKLSALLSITAGNEALLLESELELSEVLLERLQRYIIADDVVLEVIEAAPKIHFFGPILEHPILKGITATNINRLGVSGKDVDLFQLETLAGMTSQEPMPQELVEAFRIAQGIPRWGSELTEETLPPEARLEESCIDYEKGCYVGQEIISRLKSKGHVNRILSGFVGVGEIPLTRGMQLFSEAPFKNLEKRGIRPSSESSDSAEGQCLNKKQGNEVNGGFSEGEKIQQVGVLTSVAKKPDGNQFIALGYLKRGYDNIGAQLTAIDPATEVATHVTVATLPIHFR